MEYLVSTDVKLDIKNKQIKYNEQIIPVTDAWYIKMACERTVIIQDLIDNPTYLRGCGSVYHIHKLAEKIFDVYNDDCGQTAPIELFNEIIEENKNNFLCENLDDATIFKKQLDKEIECFKKALELTPFKENYGVDVCRELKHLYGSTNNYQNYDANIANEGIDKVIEFNEWCACHSGYNYKEKWDCEENLYVSAKGKIITFNFGKENIKYNDLEIPMSEAWRIAKAYDIYVTIDFYLKDEEYSDVINAEDENDLFYIADEIVDDFYDGMGDFSFNTAVSNIVDWMREEKRQVEKEETLNELEMDF